ncbi:MAG: EAL domain-containing protein [Moorellaceae bacterium]
MQEFQYSPYILPLLAVGAMSAGIAWYSWKRRITPGAAPLALLALALTVWSVGYALEIAGSDLSTKVFWAKMQYLGTVAAPVCWLLFALVRTNPGRQIPPRAMMVLWIVPLVTLILVFTTEKHGLVWQQMQVREVENFSALVVSHGWWFWVHSGYSYILLLTGAVIILCYLGRLSGPYGGQSIALTIAVLAPWAGNLLYLTGVRPLPHLDPTPFAFSVTVLALTCGIFKFQLLDLVPVAYSTVFQEMPDGVIILDAAGRIVEFNLAAQEMLRFSPAEAVGKTAAELSDVWAGLSAAADDAWQSLKEMALPRGESQRWYEVRVTPLYGRRKRLLGKVITLHEVTERKEMEERLKESEMRAQQQRRSVIISLAAHPAISSGNVSKAAKILTKSSCVALQVDRVGVWLLSEDGLQLRCLDLYCAATGEHEEGASFEVVKYPQFFRAIRQENCIAASDVYSDPRTSEFAGDYFAPAGVVSALNAGIFVEGKLAGVLSYEKREQKREWQPDEEVFAGTIASLIAQTLVNAERKKMENEIYNLAFYDPLTGLANRRLLMDRLRQATLSSQRTGKYGALLLLDLDNFKTLNDTQGHDVGDALLVQLAERLKAELRASDTIARLGGDEFVVLLEEVGEDAVTATAQARRVAEKIRSLIAQPFVLPGLTGGDYRITTSIGITLFHGQESLPKDLLKRADLALFQAKQSGRNTVRLFDAQMQAFTEALAELETNLRRAVEKREFELYYQPIVNAEGKVVGAEALLRWRRPDGELILPSQFIPLAETTGLILPLGQWVWEEACRRLEVWAREPALRHLYLAVNVSAWQLRQPDFVDLLLSPVIAARIDGSRLKLEITENTLLENFEDTNSKMRRLKTYGIGFCLDDFGTGYSSLAYLKSLPLDQLKIDRSFVRDLPHSVNDAAIIQAIIAIGSRLNIEVIAEGVETEAQKEFLLSLGCQAFQGYLFGKPVPPEEFEAEVRRRELSRG